MESEIKMNEVLKAVSSAMGEVKKVAKLGQNTHDKYAFASIDDFLALVNPVCAAAELTILCDEEKIEDFTRKGKYGENAWIRATFSFTVYHSSGQCLPKTTRTVEVIRNGAQAYGSAQSYALKQFLRSLFLIPTGDKDDADLQATDAGVVSGNQQQQEAPTPTPQELEIARSSINNAETLDALGEIWRGLPAHVRTPLIADKDKRKAELSEPAADPITKDEIPY